MNITVLIFGYYIYVDLSLIIYVYICIYDLLNSKRLQKRINIQKIHNCSMSINE